MVSTRFAPSPTGYLHIGGLRTALLNYLWARKNGGKFYLRIEDTDLKRNSQEATKAIIQAFDWLGLDYDGEVIYQSKRFDLYRQYIDRLLEEGKAYYCYMSKEELDALRQEQIANGQRPRYDNRYRDFTGTPPAGIEPVVRIKAPTHGAIVIADGIKGEITINSDEVDDFIIARSDGTPTYNFVVAIDDATMGLSDIIRGDDHLYNTPKQLIIYEALGLRPPNFYHVPMINNEAGKKMSKRDGALDVMEYKKMGYLPEALLNFLVRLGWSYGDQEIFSLDDMLKKFDPKDLNSSASAFNVDKLNWLNSHYIKNCDNDRLAKLLEEFDIYIFSHDKKEILLDESKERSKTIKQLAQNVYMIVVDPSEYDKKAVKKAAKNYDILIEFYNYLESYDKQLHLPSDFHQVIESFLDKKQLGFGKLGQPLRVALVGAMKGPGLDVIMSAIGKKQSMKRIKKALEVFDTQE
ncbi:MAG: glutamate--tRNA ligase [Campylobacterota bacterium]